MPLPLDDGPTTDRAARRLLVHLDESSPLPGPDPSQEPSLRTQVRAAVYYLLTRDFERLIRVCYQLDVPESDFARALGGPNMEAVAEQLGDAMIRREHQRLSAAA